MDQAVRPELAALNAQGIDYRGVLYAGIMLTAEGPKVLEFNVRFGDPETQVLLPRWQGDVAEMLAAAAAGALARTAAPTFDAGAAVCVVLAAEGYPGTPRTGIPSPGWPQRPPWRVCSSTPPPSRAARQASPPAAGGSSASPPPAPTWSRLGTGPTPGPRSSTGPGATTAATSRPGRHWG